MINETLALQLQLAQSRTEFNTIAQKNGLSCRDSLKAPVAFAFVKGDFKNKIVSNEFCSVCGNKSEHFIEDTRCDDVLHCKRCHMVLKGELNTSNNQYNPNQDPWFDANYIPEHVTNGEIHDDKMAMFRSEY